MWGVALAAAALAGYRVHNREPHEFPLTVAARGRLRTGLEKSLHRRLHTTASSPDQRNYTADIKNIPIRDERIGIFVDLYVGSNLQRQRVLFDTSLACLAVYSTLCGQCPRDNDLYDPTVSGVPMLPSQCPSLLEHGNVTGNVTLEQPTLAPTPSGDVAQCKMSVSYGYVSGWDGVVYWDVISFHGEADGFLLNTTVAAILHESGSSSIAEGDLLRGYATGIMGAAWRSASRLGLPTPPEAYMEANNLTKVMSLCLNDNGGVIKLGGLLKYYTGAVQYEPLIMHGGNSSTELDVGSHALPGLWSVQVTGIAVGGTSLGFGVDSFGVEHVVDSGFSGLIIPVNVYDEVENKLIEAGMNRSLRAQCIPKDSVQFDGLPNVTIALTNVTLTLSPRDYITEFGMVCPEVDPAIPHVVFVISPSHNITILGLALLRRYMSVWDYDRKAIGFAVAQDCPAGPIAAEFTAYPTTLHPTAFPRYPTTFPTDQPTSFPIAAPTGQNCKPLGNCWYLDLVGVYRDGTWSGEYRNNAFCDIPLPGGGPSVITVERFDTERCCDFLIVDGVRYSGRSGPDGVLVNSSLEWTTDHSVGRSGWEICLHPQTASPLPERSVLTSTANATASSTETAEATATSVASASPTSTATDAPTPTTSVTATGTSTESVSPTLTAADSSTPTTSVTAPATATATATQPLSETSTLADAAGDANGTDSPIASPLALSMVLVNVTVDGFLWRVFHRQVAHVAGIPSSAVLVAWWCPYSACAGGCPGTEAERLNLGCRSEGGGAGRRLRAQQDHVEARIVVRVELDGWPAGGSAATVDRLVDALLADKLLKAIGLVDVIAGHVPSPEGGPTTPSDESAPTAAGATWGDAGTARLPDYAIALLILVGFAIALVVAYAVRHRRQRASSGVPGSLTSVELSQRTEAGGAAPLSRRSSHGQPEEKGPILASPAPTPSVHPEAGPLSGAV
eukprot:TRINITY_DN3541_c0_g1_i1.p1 TRINITY_DN3541_c0_g1~~TRINITY_DN3541_c0_g1_i1.p1  ORF type:complete len:982 (+),score=96.63 TRINITY_DN3541_c0_g1_i1:68-2947(+)